MAEARLLENVFRDPSLGALFQQPAFFELHADGRGVYFEWEQDGQVLASVHFTAMGEGCWRSPARGTYAGFAMRPGLRYDALLAFHDAVLERLAALGATRLELLPAPMAHDGAAFANQVHLLQARGWAISQCDLNHSLAVDERPLEARMTYGNVKRLRKCRREGVSAMPLPPGALPEVYDVIAANRLSKGYGVSMTLEALQAMQARFPGVMRLFGSRMPDGELAAAAVCLRLTPGILYVFYWGDRPGFAQLSPVVSVADAIHAHCQEEGIKLLDAGTSTVGTQANMGLIQFKRGLGFTESLKLRFSRSL